jgi:riboflavin kinase/FMN adenylyltransferase
VRTFDGLGAVPRGFGPSAVTIGKFDGVHEGHRAVIAKLREIAEARRLAAVAITFDRHPAAFHAPDRCPPQLISTRQKLELLATTGLDATVLLHYDAALASNTADEFVRRFLVEALQARVLLVGHDFRYGAGNEGDVGMLRGRARSTASRSSSSTTSCLKAGVACPRRGSASCSTQARSSMRPSCSVTCRR